MLAILTPKLRQAAGELRHLPEALTLVWQAAARWSILWLALLVLQGLVPLASVYYTRPFVDGLVAITRGARTTGAGDLEPVLWPLTAIAFALVLGEALRAASSWVRTAQSELVQDHINALLYRKSVEADLAFYDSPEFHDRLYRARLEATYRPVQLIETLGALLQNTVTLVAMLGVLIPFGVWLPAALFLGTLPAFFAVLRHTIRQHELRRRTTADERRTWYYDWVLTAREAAAELRLFDLGPRFQSAWSDLRGRLRRQRLALASANAAAELAAGAAALVLTGAAMAWMLWRAVSGLISLGDLALFFAAFQQGLRLMRSLLENVGQLYYNSLFLGNLFEYPSIQPRILAPAHPLPAPPALRDGIRLRDVTFTYPGSARPVLERFNLEIPACRITALVGPNGAGKSTIASLLCRLYQPDSGVIEMDGTDVADFDPAELRRRISFVFQVPVRFNDTASDNIAFGDSVHPPDASRIAAAATAAGAGDIVERLPSGYDTLLGKTFSHGVELSTGEWQRIALARAFARPAPLLLLDEPTSAMDPWAEAEWLERFREAASGRTAVIITHRLTTAMRADLIHVIAGGRSVESGSHQQLLALNGMYALLWMRDQARQHA